MLRYIVHTSKPCFVSFEMEQLKILFQGRMVPFNGVVNKVVEEKRFAAYSN